jgi:hypothetical protein
MPLITLLPRLAAALAFTLLLASTANASDKKVAGVAFEEQVRVGETPMLLNGAGVRSKFFIKAYVIGLYLPHKSASAEAAIGQAGPKRVRLVGLRDVNVSMFLSGLHSGLEKNLAHADLAALQPRLDQFNATLKAIGEIPEGAPFTIDLTADNLTRLAVKGNAVGQDIAGADFYQALLRVWLGEKPAQEDLKAALLGQ